MLFAFEALTADGRALSDRVEAGTQSEAADALRNRGYLVMRVTPATAEEPARASALKVVAPWSRRVTGRDLMVFTRQAKMLLDAGAALVPALEAIESQCTKAGMRAVVRQLRDHVEQGGALSDALAKRSDVFPPVFCSMMAAGEA